MKRFFVENGIVRAHVTECGDPHKPVIFCLHGLGSSSLSFIELGEGLKNRFRVIAIDAPGHGRTPAFQKESDYEMPAMVDWLYHVLDLLKIDRFYFLSHSWGSFVALHFLASHPDRVKGSILIDGGYQTKRESSPSMEEEMDYYEKDFDEYRFDSWEAFLEVERTNYLRLSPLLEEAVKDLMIEEGQRIRWHAKGNTARHLIRAMHKHETADIYHLLPKSIILLRATLPDSWEEYRIRLADLFRLNTDGIVIPVAGASHMLHWDQPDVVIQEVVRNWLD